MDCDQRWAIVTGASSGLGIEIARQLAARGHSLVVTARNGAKLDELAEELRRRYRNPVIVESIDLAAPEGPPLLLDRLRERDITPDVLINNAGVGLYGPFLDQDAVRLRALLQLDLVSLTELTHAVARVMAAGRGGRILLVSSMAAYQPVPLLSVYAAAKAYVLSLGEALSAELAPKVIVTVLSPGLMDTGFNAASGFVSPPALERMKLPPADVARIGLDALFAGRSGVIAGRLNKAMALSSRLLPRGLAARTSLAMERRRDVRVG